MKYEVYYQGPFGHAVNQTSASNVHTAVKNILASAGGRTRPKKGGLGRLKPVSLGKGQTMIIRVTRLV